MGCGGVPPHTRGRRLRPHRFQRWRRNLAVALGNAWRAAGQPAVAQALSDALPAADALVAEHIAWALAQRPAAPPGVQV